MDQAGRLGFVMGVNSAVFDILLPHQLNSAYDSGLTFGEVVEGITQFYQESENGPIPIVWAFQYVAYKSKGASAAQLQGQVELLRKLSHGVPLSSEGTPPQPVTAVLFS